jgi:hypothetical protein
MYIYIRLVIMFIIDDHLLVSQRQPFAVASCLEEILSFGSVHEQTAENLRLS